LHQLGNAVELTDWRSPITEEVVRQGAEAEGLPPAAVALPLVGGPLAVEAPLAAEALLAAEDPLSAVEPPSAEDGHSRTAQSSRQTLSRAALLHRRRG
jgi:hypothetical protein